MNKAGEALRDPKMSLFGRKIVLALGFYKDFL